MRKTNQYIPILIFSILLLFISPALLAYASNQRLQDTIPIPSSGHRILQDKNIPNCQLMHQCALRFNGIDQWVVQEQLRGFDTAAFTLETWFNWAGDGTPIPENQGDLSDGIPFISIGDGEGSGTGADANLFFGIQASTGRLMAAFKEEPSISGSPAQDFPIFGNTPITPGTWHHAAITYDGQTWRLYLDGKLDARLTYAAPIMPKLIDSRLAYLAAVLSSTDKGLGFFKGDLDQVRIWETARTQNDILTAVNLEDVSDPRLIGQWNMNEGNGMELNDSSRKGIQAVAVNNPDWTDGAPFNLPSIPLGGLGTSEVSHDTVTPNASLPPNQPVLIAPANGATDVSTSPTLNVTVSDPDTSSLTVNFYGRAAPGSHSPDFTVVALPDTQMYTANDTGIFEMQTQWIVDHRTTNNIVFVTHLGDLVNSWNISSEWNIANTAMSKLEPPGIPYGISVGNCDMSNNGVPKPDPNVFNSYFPYSRFVGRSYYGGAYNNNNANSYQLFTASGMDFIVIHLEYNLSSDPNHLAIMSWANALLQTNNSRRAIIVTHDLLTYTSTFSTDGSTIYNALKGNPNLFLMLGGHLDDEGRRQDLGTDGHTIYSLRSDYQVTRTNGGNGFLRLLTFSPDSNKINVFTYSPSADLYETDNTSQFSLDYNMNGTSYQLIGTKTVSSGSSTNVTWPNLAVGTQYQWYVTVNDGTSTTVGPTWSFTTTSTPAAPVITLQPSNQTINAGQVASFSAAATGSPTPTVQWQVSTDNGATWTDIFGATSTVYTFTAQLIDNAKQYRAIFTNTAGSATTNAATLTVNAPPVVTSQPSNQTVNAGETAAFTAVASGSPSPTVQWQVSTNGTTWTNIDFAIWITYSFIAQAADNGKQYHAVFTNTAGSATSNAAVLTVNSAPVITTQPTNQTVNAGQTATFTAAASGYPTPTVQWQVSMDNGSTWSNITSATSTTYSFPTLAADNGKQYHAVFTNMYGSATTNAATLTVNTPPVITTQPINQTVNAGQTASFTAAASGNPIPTVQWQVSTNNGSTWTNISGATSTTYTTLPTLAADNGKQYRAVFTNVAGSVNTTAAVLTVYFAPTVTTHPTNQTVNAGQTATFTAAASGNPTPAVQWQVSIDNGTSWSDISGATSATYSFTAQSTDNGKRYRAVFTNSVGSATSNAAILAVNYSPTVTTQPVNQTVNSGQTASFTAAASGNPAPTVQWQLSTNNGSTWTNISGATSTTYTTLPTLAGDNGKQYRAVFTNSVGSATSNAATLTVNTAPVITMHPSNQTVSAGQIASFTAAASGNPSPSVQWQVSIDNGTSWSDISGATMAPYSFTAQSTDTGKRYRAVFTNFLGSATSNAATLTVNTAPVITMQPSNQTVNAGQTASFTAAASGLPTPTVQWQLSINNGSTWSNISGATSTTYSFTAQAADNAKQYRVVFTNSVGSTTSNAATLTINTAPVITTQPSNQTVNAGQTTSFTSAASGNPTPTVQWQVSPNGTDWSDISGATSATYSFTAQSTDNGKQYRAVFTNSAGSATSTAAILTVHTGPVITLQPVNQSVIAGQTATFTTAATGSPTLTVQWELSSNGGATWVSISGATSTTYSFTAQATDNGKQYHAVFTNSVGSATTNPATLMLNTVPVITIQPINQTVNTGQKASFTAAASGNPTPTVQWQVSSNNGNTWTNIAGATSTTYSFTAQAADNGKQYRAVFTNLVGSATSGAAALNVNYYYSFLSIVMKGALP
jgi:hypothetical protein